MFDDIPEELNRWLLEAPEAIRRDHYSFSHLAMRLVCAFFLGKNFGGGSNFLNYEPTTPGRVPWRQTARYAQIAQALFGLRAEPGFPEICRRLASRDLQSAFYEATAAELLRERGFAILAREETGKTGLDFDFAIAGLGIWANVEATSIKLPRFNETTVRNKLKKKKSQLPADAPAIIMCFLPHAWQEGTPDFERRLGDMAVRFFRTTQRINHLIFITDMMVPMAEGGGAIMRIAGYGNWRARYPTPALDQIMMRRTEDDRREEAFWNDPVNPGDFTGSSDLFKWIDWLKSRQT
jgi:hypothetical protein